MFESLDEMNTSINLFVPSDSSDDVWFFSGKLTVTKSPHPIEVFPKTSSVREIYFPTWTN